MKNHEDLIIQEEIDCSSWFAFSLIIKPESKLTRKHLMNQLNALGFEYRPILTGNFVKQAEDNSNRILSENIEMLHGVANALLEYESISGDEMNSVINGESIIRAEPKAAPKRTRRSKKVSKEFKEEASSIDDSAPIITKPAT